MNLLSLLFDQPALFFVLVGALVLSLSVHEYSHALMGFWLGDPTAERMNRLTLNPLAHLDPLGFLALLTVGFGWAKPVPFNPYNLRYRRWGPAFVAIAGPLANLLLGTACAIAFAFLSPSLGYQNLLVVALAYVGLVNYSLMLFNVIPVAPLDGSKVLFSFLDGTRYAQLRDWLEFRGPTVLLLLIIVDALVGFGVFSWIPHLAASLFDVVSNVL